jgi:hypothetical protein
MLNLTPEQLNMIFPVVGIIAYPGGVVVRRACNLPLSQIRHLHIRGAISMVSKRSMNKLALLVRSTEVKFLSAMTLTYGQNYPLSGRIAKKHLNNFLISMKREFGPFEYVWCLEFQERGAVHFHVVSTLSPPGPLQLHSFANIWLGISLEGDWLYSEIIWNGKKFVSGQTLGTQLAGYSVHSHPKSWEPIRKRDGVARYFAKYANKLKQKVVPTWYYDVGRFWGASRGVRMPEGKNYHGGDKDIRALALEYGRDISSWRVLPKVILLG